MRHDYLNVISSAIIFRLNYQVTWLYIDYINTINISFPIYVILVLFSTIYQRNSIYYCDIHYNAESQELSVIINVLIYAIELRLT